MNDGSNVDNDDKLCDDDVDDAIVDMCSNTNQKVSGECPNITLDNQRQYENSKNRRAAMREDYERETNLERKQL